MSVMDMEKKTRRLPRRKVTKVGNSFGITLPTEYVQKKGIELGDEFEITLNERGQIILTPERKVTLPDGVRGEVLNLFAETLDQYNDVLRTLKDK